MYMDKDKDQEQVYPPAPIGGEEVTNQDDAVVETEVEDLEDDDDEPEDE